MEKKNKYLTGGSDDFLRYRKGSMTSKERNAFEKELQRDPFTGEALEGFELVNPDEALKDLSSLRDQIKERTAKRSFAVYYRVAASLAILVTISVIFYVRKPAKEPSISSDYYQKPETTLVIAAAEPIVAKTDKPGPLFEIRKADRPESVASSTKSADIAPEPREDLVVKELNSEEAEQVEEMSAAAEEDFFQVKDMETDKKTEKSRVAGVTAPMAAKSISIENHTKPEPVEGIDSFNLYIETKINQFPRGDDSEQVVILSFVIKKDSTLTDFKIIESPGQAYSREAKRLIKEGPRWKPATVNGQPVEEEYIVRLVFN